MCLCVFTLVSYRLQFVIYIYIYVINWQPGIYNYFRLFQVASYPYFLN